MIVGSLLLSIFLNLFMMTKQVFAISLAEIEVFSNMNVANNSETTPENRWTNEAGILPLDFILKSSEILNTNIIASGEKRGILIYPEELVGKLESKTDDAPVQIDNVVVDGLDSILGLGGIITNLLASLDSLLGLIGLGALEDALSELTKDYGEQSFNSPLVSNDEYSMVNLDDTLSMILRNLTEVRLNNVLLALSSLKLLGLPVGDLLLSPLRTAIQGLLGNLNSLQQQLIKASIIGRTTITFQMAVTPPENMIIPLDAKFIGNIIQQEINLINLDLLKSSSNETFVYFAADKKSILDVSMAIPSLNFGSQTIETKKEQTLPEIDSVTGQIKISDTRQLEKKWELRVEQSQDWMNDSHILLDAALSFDLTLLIEKNGEEYLNLADEEVVLNGPGYSVPLFFVDDTLDDISLDLLVNHFQLYIPANTQKKVGTYQTNLTWTFSDRTP